MSFRNVEDGNCEDTVQTDEVRFITNQIIEAVTLSRKVITWETKRKLIFDAL